MVYALEPLGDRCLVDAQIGDSIVRVKAPPTTDLPDGAPVRVAVALDRTHLFDAHTGAAVRPRSLATGGAAASG